MEDIYLNYLQRITKTITVRGDDVPNRNSTVSHKFIIQLEGRCPELTHLSLSNQIFNASEVNKNFQFV